MQARSRVRGEIDKNGEPEEKKVAFALGGLGGHNAHGAGFLAAALHARMEPKVISCTSGQIFWVYQYLLCRKASKEGRPGNGEMRAVMKTEIEKIEQFPLQDENLMNLAMMGKPGVFAPAFPELIADFWHNAATSLQHTISDVRKMRKPFLSRRMAETIPCRNAVPEFADSFFEEIAKEFNDSDIGIAFNSYCPQEGKEYVYLNDKARKLLKLKGKSDNYEEDAVSSLNSRRVYKTISPKAVRRGLWLYNYGFTDANELHIDGAYFRDIILSELTYADRIYVARPLHYHWSGDLPSDWPGMEDLKTKISFNGSYTGERLQIALINKLLKDNKVSNDKYHKIDLEEIEMDKATGFFGYVFEELSVFDEAFQKSMRKFSKAPAHTGKTVATH